MKDPTRKYENDHCVLCDHRFPTTMQVIDSANLVCEKCIETITTKLAIADVAIAYIESYRSNDQHLTNWSKLYNLCRKPGATS